MSADERREAHDDVYSRLEWYTRGAGETKAILREARLKPVNACTTCAGC